MTSRSALQRLLAVALLSASRCAGPNRAEPIPEAAAGCEDPGPDQRTTQANMLPGRVCGACHKTGGQATNSPWTISGTIYGDPKSSCNSGGLAGVNVEISYAVSDPNGQYRGGEIQPGGLLVTNSVGNFHTAARFVPPIKIRIYTGDTKNPDKFKSMSLQLGTNTPGGQPVKIDCATCHQLNGGTGVNGTEGRIYLN